MLEGVNKKYIIIIILTACAAAIGISVSFIPDEVLFGIYGDRMQSMPLHIFCTFAYTFRYIGAFLVLGVLSILLSLRVSSLWFYGFECSLMHGAVLSQVMIIIYIYVRSLVNSLLPIVIPITTIDIVLIIAVLGYSEWRRYGFRRMQDMLMRQRTVYAALFFFLFIMIAVFSFLDLPRISVMSSDPNQHAFWAKQLSRFMTLPYFSQFHWGEIGFGYPAGFAVLNYTWHMLTGIDVRAIVTLQPMIQTMIMILIAFEVVYNVLSKNADVRSVPQLFFFMLIICAVYVGVVPNGYLFSHLNHPGTARISALAFVGLITSFVFSSIVIKDVRQFYVSLAAACAVAALLFLLNPALLFLPVFLLSLTALAWIIMTRSWRYAPWLLVPAAVPLYAVLDEYVLAQFLKSSFAPASGRPDIAGSALTHTPSLQELIRQMSVLRISVFFPFLKEPNAWIVIGVLLAALSIAIFVHRRESFSKAMIGILVIAGVIVFCAGLVMALLCFVPGLVNASYLIIPYTVFSFHQYIYVLIWFAVIALVGISFRYFRTAGGFIPLTIIAVLLVLVISPGRQFTVYPRVYTHGGIGETARDDLAVIRHIERIYAGYRAQKRNALAWKETPKTLILNDMRIAGSEEWLFPAGAGWIVPFYDVFPTAFFFSQGSRSYSYENYEKHVVKRFDIAWLRSNNIKYAFIPSDAACVKIAAGALSRIKERAVYASGRSCFAELW